MRQYVIVRDFNLIVHRNQRWVTLEQVAGALVLAGSSGAGVMSGTPGGEHDVYRTITANAVEQPLAVQATADGMVVAPPSLGVALSLGTSPLGGSSEYSVVLPTEEGSAVSPRVEATHVSRWAMSGRKRVFDLVLALTLVMPLMMVTLVVALVAALAFRAWPFFVQTRVGLDGKLFKVVKVRSLPTTWHADKGKHELQHEEMPKISRLLRATHFDEVPQVFNVLLGQMSFVGPRPMITGVLSFLSNETAQSRARVRPGITGAWQISTMGGAPLHECPALDIAYVQHASARGDLWLMWHTVAAHLWGEALEPTVIADRLSRMAGVVADDG